MNIFEHGAFILRHINITCDSIWGLNHIKCSVVQVFCGKYYMSGSVLVQHSEECKQFSTVQNYFYTASQNVQTPRTKFLFEAIFNVQK